MLSGVRAEQQTSFLNCTATSRSDLHAIWPSLNSFLPPSGCSSLFLGFSGDFALPSLAFWSFLFWFLFLDLLSFCIFALHCL